jgi:cell division protein FtsQ
MWPRSEKEKRGRQELAVSFNERRERRLRVQTGGGLRSHFRWRWFGGAAAVLIGLLALAVVGWVGLQYFERRLFQQNDLFRIRNCRIDCSGEVITPKHVMDYAELGGISNIFDVNISQKREFLQKKVPRVKNVKISRRLPDELIIEVHERVAIARLEMGSYYLSVDGEGCVLGPSAGAAQLPVIGGHGMPTMRPGTRLAGTPVMNALEVFTVCENPPVRDLLKVARIEVRGREAVELTLGEGERILLAWPRMGAGDSLERDGLERKLLKLAEILKAAAAGGKRVATLDMTVENNFPSPDYDPR